MKTFNMKNFKMLKVSLLASTLALGCFTTYADEQQSDNKTLTVAMMWESNPLSFKSRRSRFFNESEVLDTLVKMDYDMTLLPGLATSWKNINDKEWLFTLRKGVKFHDGSDLTAESVINSFNKVMELLPYAPGLLDIDSMEAVGHLQVKFTTKSPFSGFPNQLTDAFTVVYAPTSFNEKGEYIKPIGTGPYKFVSYTKQDRTIVERFKNYWGNKKPSITKVVYRYIPDHAARSLALEAGEVDVATNVLPADVKRLDKSPKYKVNRAPTAGLYYLVLNNDKSSPLSDVKVRRAINYMIDRDSLVKYSLEGVGIPAFETFSPQFGLVNEELKYSYDLEKANKLLKEAGYVKTDNLWSKNGKPLNLKLITYQSRAEMQTILDTISNMLKQNGIGSSLKIFTWAGMQDSMTNRDYDMYAVYWDPEKTGNPDSYLRPHYISNSNMMKSSYSNKQLDELLLKARGQYDKKERDASYKKILDIIHNDAPIVPLVHKESVIATSNSIKGFRIHPSGFFFDFKSVIKE